MPAAGVTATRPATAPDAPPSSDGLPETRRSIPIHASTPAAGATKVLTIATAASPLASSAEPALKPNQPTHSRPAPTIVSASECGGIASFKCPILGPANKTPTSPAIPALMCTTVPPAKSIAPIANSKPSDAHTMCASGA